MTSNHSLARILVTGGFALASLIAAAAGAAV
ncbi:hypothetical protein M2351_003574 [Azospirillum canadense]|nr:hypothetical protein [Azospirillum canadense]